MLKKGVRFKYRADVPGSHVFEYKDPSSLGRFLAEGGKIVPSRISKLSQQQQRQLVRAIKRARNLGLLPQGSEAFDRSHRAEAISPRPFELVAKPKVEEKPVEKVEEKTESTETPT